MGFRSVIPLCAIALSSPVTMSKNISTIFLNRFSANGLA